MITGERLRLSFNNGAWKRERECTPPVRFTLYPNSSAMGLDYTFADRQAKAAPADVDRGGRLGPLIRPKDPIPLVPGYPDTLVGDRNDNFSIGRLRGETDMAAPW